MKKFFLGLVVGATAVYVASKMSDEESRDEFYKELKRGKRKAKWAGLKLRHEASEGFDKASETFNDVKNKAIDEIYAAGDKVADGIQDLGDKVKGYVKSAKG